MAIARANVPGRIEKIHEAGEQGEELKYGPELDAMVMDTVEVAELVAIEEPEAAATPEESEDDVDYEVKGGSDKMFGSGVPEQW